MSGHRIYGLILAAGRSSRFGADKLVAPLNGRPLLAHVLERVAEARATGLLRGALVVLPSGNVERAAVARTAGVDYIVNDSVDRGLARSIGVGLGALASRDPESDAALIFPADQPFVRLDVIGCLVAAWSTGGSAALRPRYADDPGTPGHPVLLDRDLWTRVAEIGGDTGFAPVLEKYPDLVTTVEVSGINPDIDRIADLTSLENRAR